MSFSIWTDYFGELTVVTDTDVVTGRPLATRLFGFENLSDPARAAAEIPGGGGCFGFVAQGAVELVEPVDGADRALRAEIGPLEYFATAGAAALRLAPATRVVVSQRLGHVGLRQRGGPIEPTGRLRYIDGCSDTLLAGPARRGDPCLNHLHFPPGVLQTEHHHPSARTGVVARGAGWCDTAAGRDALRPGTIFCIPAGGRHRFVTDDASLDVIAFHPDSDTGPTDDDHPMINRTWLTAPSAEQVP
ncbi:cupin domain-containing protein [Frankia nepalensis]|uniref:Cupin domain-containing protein n=1 Tax=Frankia nepalensis TaxID=1836974 RepID=A0A937RDZ8_9ACTN|nr:cupin domain-containing protein [Frankia nepalensis]MBL7625704.1 cupin domain-containing protein [Frankia nepalensis]